MRAPPRPAHGWKALLLTLPSRQPAAVGACTRGQTRMQTLSPARIVPFRPIVPGSLGTQDGLGLPRGYLEGCSTEPDRSSEPRG